MSTNILLYKITLLLYFASTVLYLIDVIGRRTETGKIGRWILVGGLVTHCATVATRYVATGHTPVVNLHESLSFFALAIVAIFLIFDFRYRLTILGAFSCPLALIMMIIGAAATTPSPTINPALESWWFPVHVLLAFTGDAVFAVAAIAGVMYLMQERMLKSKRFSALYYRMPSLDILDSINYKCLTFGFPLMTMGIISGAIWAHSAWGGYWRWDPKETWALITWFIYAALLHARLSVGWRGRRAAILAIVGFLCVLFTFLGVNFLLSDLHSFRTMQGG
ncbi:MAG: c-type cytochrome biogenesis protein CcsB [Desulfuromonas sp.]|nr:MAG: c-type cytochrome biogenesis protein CcsB [Desulfuromonas sp.]